MSEREKVTVRLNDGREFTLGGVDEATLGQLGPAILEHLGCSFQIVWPVKTDEDRARREQDRRANRRRRQDQAEEYARVASYGHRFSESDREVIAEMLQAAFLVGWDAAPKPVGYLR